MGLTIHYDLKPPVRMRSASKVGSLIEKLRQRTMDLPFQSCDDKTLHLEGSECEFDTDGGDRDDPLRWMKIQASEYVTVDGCYCNVAPLNMFAFTCCPGQGCESMNIGLCRYPKTISINGKAHSTRLGGWRWGSFCKTQYASNVGVRHFLHCHNLVCVLLDVAKDLGFRVRVKDEGGFYQGRDFEALTKEVADWNVMIAGFAGKLKDAFQSMSIAAPITDHPAFEHLEAKSNADATGLITLLANASQEEIRAHRLAHPDQWGD